MITTQNRQIIVVHDAKIGTNAAYALTIDEIMGAIQKRDDARLEASLDDDIRQARLALQWRVLGYVWAVALLWVLFFSR